MSVPTLLRKAAGFVDHNSPQILTAVGVAGTITTAYLASRGTMRYAEVLAAEERLREAKAMGAPHKITRREKFGLGWQFYIPAVITGGATVSAILMANRIGMRRTAAMAAAYTISERAMAEYSEKVVEQIGKNKEAKIREEVATNRVNGSNVPPAHVFVDEDGMVMCHDAFSNQYFRSDMESLRRAENDINQMIFRNDSATVSDLYRAINAKGLETTDVSGELGWNTDKFCELDLSNTVLYKDRIPCISMSFATMPIPEPWRFV